MKKNVLAIVALTVLVAPMTSVASDGNFYIKGNLGVGMPLDSDVDNLPGYAGTTEMSFDTGFAGSLAGGYDFANPLRVEIETIFRRNDIDSLIENDLAIDFGEGDLSSHSLMLNGYYDIDTGSPWTPFAGVGIGGSRIEPDVLELDNDGNDPVFTYQFIAGISYAFNENLSADAQYRYIGTSDVTIDDTEFDFGSNNLMLGIRYTF